MLNIAVGDLIRVVVELGAVFGVFSIIVSWINRKLKRIDKLERVVFNEHGGQRYATVYKFAEIEDKLDRIMKAINNVNESQMVQLDVQIETCCEDDLRIRLEEEKQKLNEKRGIV